MQSDAARSLQRHIYYTCTIKFSVMGPVFCPESYHVHWCSTTREGSVLRVELISTHLLPNQFREPYYPLFGVHRSSVQLCGTVFNLNIKYLVM